jgi:hypothetical protein
MSDPADPDACSHPFPAAGRAQPVAMASDRSCCVTPFVHVQDHGSCDAPGYCDFDDKIIMCPGQFRAQIHVIVPRAKGAMPAATIFSFRCSFTPRMPPTIASNTNSGKRYDDRELYERSPYSGEQLWQSIPEKIFFATKSWIRVTSVARVMLRRLREERRGDTSKHQRQ